MKKLDLKFLDKPRKGSLSVIEKILHETGEQIYQYAKGYFNYIVTTTSVDEEIRDASLYIIIPEISYDYRILTLEYENTENILVHFFTLKTNQTQSERISIKNNLEPLENKITELLNGGLAQTTFSFLINQVELRRESRNNMY